nr:hypothetical protein [Cupriavidus gilardii]
MPAWHPGTRIRITGARQPAAANALWHALDDLHCRMVLLGRGWTVERFARAVGMRL